MHSREKKSSSTRQNTDASFPNQEYLDKPIIQPHPLGETSTIKRNHRPPEYRKATPNSNLNKMKRQRNTQQVKEHEKCPPTQTKEEIGNLPEKEFRIIIIKMIQNLENKMKLQINSLETRIE